MSGHRKFSELRDEVVARLGATDRLARARAATLEEIRLPSCVTSKLSARPNSPAGSNGMRRGGSRFCSEPFRAAP